MEKNAERPKAEKHQVLQVVEWLLRSSQKMDTSGGSRQTRAQANISAHRKMRYRNSSAISVQYLPVKTCTARAASSQWKHDG